MKHLLFTALVAVAVATIAKGIEYKRPSVLENERMMVLKTKECVDKCGLDTFVRFDEKGDCVCRSNQK